jgi:transcriptional regulator with XRE-family HTH domain
VALKKIELLRLVIRIQRARKFSGFSQKGFALICGLDRSYFSGIERGERNLSFSILCTICDGLTCDVASLTNVYLGFPVSSSEPCDSGMQSVNGLTRHGVLWNR